MTSAAQIEIPAGWRPRRYQWPLWRYLWDGGKRAVAVWHRRAGKDDLALHWAACAAHMRVGTYWHLLPEAAQARKAIWDAVNPHTGRRRIDEAFPLVTRELTRDHEMFIRFRSGSTWQVVGSDNYNSLIGAPPVGIVFSEWAIANPMAWAYLQPILEENGGWGLWIYTSRGRNHGFDTFRHAESQSDWFAERLPASATDVFAADQLEAIRAEMLTLYPRDGEARFRQEYQCDFETSAPGAVYGAQLQRAQDQGRIGRVPHDPAHPVDTWWDLGRSDATAIWFVQRVGPETRLIDFLAASGADPPYYAGVLQERARPVSQGGCGYVYGRHLGPHDAGHKLLAASGRSIAEQFGDLGVPMEVGKREDLDAGIQEVRMRLPTMWFDAERCAAGLDALRSYRYAYQDAARDWSREPVHDWSSHACDALRTGVAAQARPKKQWTPIEYPKTRIL